MPTPYGSRGGMAFGANELRVLRRALALALDPSPARARDVQDCLRLARSVEEAVNEATRLRSFLRADLARYRAALPGSLAGYLALLEELQPAGSRLGPDDLAALRALRANPRVAALLSRCAPPGEDVSAPQAPAVLPARVPAPGAAPVPAPAAGPRVRPAVPAPAAPAQVPAPATRIPAVQAPVHRASAVAGPVYAGLFAPRSADRPARARLRALPGGRLAGTAPRAAEEKPDPAKKPAAPQPAPGRPVPTPAEVFPPRRRQPPPREPEQPERRDQVHAPLARWA